MTRRHCLNFTVLLCCLLAPIFAEDCVVGQYKCEVSGKCIGIDNICDGTVDCTDNEEDEWTCELEPTKCLGPTKVCDGIKDCDNNEDEENCCKHSSENNPCTGSKEGWFHCECSHTCIPPNEGDDPENPLWAVCNGKNDCCGTIHGVLSQGPKECADNNKANYTALDELQENGEPCVTECPEGEIQCLHDNDNPLPLKCIPADKRCNGVNDCGTAGKNDEMQENGEDCATVCTHLVELQCSDVLPLECVSRGEYCLGTVNCSNDKQLLCPVEGIKDYCNAEEEHACVDKNNRFENLCIGKEQKCDDTPDCPSGSDENDCSSLWWLWLLIVILILLLLILLLLFCLYKQGKIGRYNVKDKLTASENGSQLESEPLNGEKSQEKSQEKVSPGSINGGSIPNPISLHSPSGKGSELASPVASPEEPLSSEGLSAAIKNDDFDWEGAAQQIIKDNRKKTSNIKIKPDQGFLMKEFPTNRIHEERPVSPIPAVQFAAPSSDQPGNPEYGHKKSWAPPVLESQVSETGDVVRYTGVTHAPVLIKSKKRYANTPIDYTDPKDF